MPKFKYVPNKDNKETSTEQTKDEKVVVSPENKLSSNTQRVERPVQPTPTPFKPIQMPQQQPKPYTPNPQPSRQMPETTAPLKPIVQKPIEPKVETKEAENIDLLINFDNKKTPIEKSKDEENQFINSQPIQKEKTKPKINLKLIVVLVAIAVAISMVFGVSQVVEKDNYSITTQDLAATSVQNIEEGALIDIQAAVPLNLSIRDFNISTSKTDNNTITLSLWDFTDTNQNKVSITVDGNVVENGLTLTKKPFHIDVPATSKVEIMQVETVNSPYTPYALQVNGITYFNRLSAEKTNNYQFLVMDEIQDLQIEDFAPISEETENPEITE